MVQACVQINEKDMSRLLLLSSALLLRRGRKNAQTKSKPLEKTSVLTTAYATPQRVGTGLNVRFGRCAMGRVAAGAKGLISVSGRLQR